MADALIVEEILILADQPDDSVLVDEVEVVSIVAVAEQGPRGIQGIQGPAGGTTTVTVGATPLSGHSAVAVDAAGLLTQADCTNPAHRGAVLGLLANAYSPGDQAVVQTAFTLEHSGWTWSPGPVFVGTAGQLTQTLPVGAVFSQVVAHALSPTLVLVDVQPPITIA
ncbi:MAG: hypothetical protein ABFE02_01500 [Sulfuricella sp.]